MTAKVEVGKARGALNEDKDDDGNPLWIFFGELLVPGAGAHVMAMFTEEDQLDFAPELLTRLFPPSGDEDGE